MKKKPDTPAERERILEKASSAVGRPVGSDFTPVESGERRSILLRAAPLARQPSQLWTQDRKLKKKFFVRRFNELQEWFECEFAQRASRVLGDVDRELDAAGSNDIFFNVRCEESTLFFHLPRRAISSREGMLIVKIPARIYEIQRRAQLRYRASADDAFRFESEAFSAWRDGLETLDVSSGGFGIQLRFADAGDAADFALAPETRIRFRLDLGVVAIAGEGEIRYLKRLEDEETGRPVVRVGIRFVALPQETVEAVQNLVLERSYSRLRQLIGD